MKWILRYLKGICRVCLSFGSAKFLFNGYIDVDMVSDMDYRISNSHYMMTFVGEWSHNNLDYKNVLFYLLRRKNNVVTEATKEVLWVQKF